MFVFLPPTTDLYRVCIRLYPFRFLIHLISSVFRPLRIFEHLSQSYSGMVTRTLTNKIVYW